MDTSRWASLVPSFFSKLLIAKRISSFWFVPCLYILHTAHSKVLALSKQYNKDISVRVHDAPVSRVPRMKHHYTHFSIFMVTPYLRTWFACRCFLVSTIDLRLWRTWSGHWACPWILPSSTVTPGNWQCQACLRAVILKSLKYVLVLFTVRR